jgi:hypothetical protein
MALPLLPTFPPRKNCRKTSTNFFQNSKKIDPKIKKQKKGNQAIAADLNLVRTQFQSLWKRNKRVALFLRVMLLSATSTKTII